MEHTWTWLIPRIAPKEQEIPRGEVFHRPGKVYAKTIMVTGGGQRHKIMLCQEIKAREKKTLHSYNEVSGLTVFQIEVSNAVLFCFERPNYTDTPKETCDIEFISMFSRGLE